MHFNEALIKSFYTAFQQRDFKTMQNCYSDEAVFSDPVFTNLNAQEVKAMWEMLCTKGKDLKLTFSNITANDIEGSANWEATYTFTATGKKVVNRIHSKFVFKDRRIASHVDTFDFYKWARQALGLKGWLLGWTPFMQNKVQSVAKSNLKRFMAKTEV